MHLIGLLYSLSACVWLRHWHPRGHLASVVVVELVVLVVRWCSCAWMIAARVRIDASAYIVFLIFIVCFRYCFKTLIFYFRFFFSIYITFAYIITNKYFRVFY